MEAEHKIYSTVHLTTRTSSAVTHYRTMNPETSFDGTIQTANSGLSQADSAETSLAVTIVTIADATSMKDSFRSLERSFVDQDILQPLSKKNNTRVDDIYCQVEP